MSYERAQKFTFFNQKDPCWILGERVVLFAPLPELPLTQPAVSQFRSLTLEHYLSHQQTQLIRAVEHVFLDLMKTYGEDCDHFEITLDEQGQPNGVIFTRPMDRVELTQVRSWRANGQPRAVVLPDPDPPPPPPAGRLPDPATLKPLRFAY